MGSDSGPHVILEASLCALKADQTLFFFFVGDKTVISNILSQPLFKQLNADQLRSSQYEIVHAQQEITMQVKPSAAFRKKDSSSMGIALQLVASGKAQGCVSSGNTAALVLLARHYLNMFADVDRPAISTVLPSEKGFTRVLDLGASIDCDSQALYYFAIMGSVVAETVDKISSPKVGLLNIGVEEVKGNDKVKQASIMLQQVEALNYSGFVEGNDIYSGKIDVVVCDGFVGNISLKTAEGVAKMITDYMKQRFKKNLYSKLAALLSMPILKALKKRFDHRVYNGASLLGLQNIVIKSHGGADAFSFSNAIKVALLEVEQAVPQRIDKHLENILEEK